MLASDIQERKNKRSLFVLITLVLVTVVTFFLLQRSERPSVDKLVFRNADLESIDAIKIQSKSDTVNLNFSNSRWILDNQYPADRKLVTLLFATLKQAEPKREINLQLADSVEKYFDRSAYEIALYNDEQSVQKFIVAGNPDKTQTFFKDPASGKVYLMTIPGYRVYVGGIFEMDDNGWRDKFVLGSFNWRNFSTLQATYHDKPGESFRVKVEGPGLLAVEGVKTDTARLNAFLYDLSVLTVQEYLDSKELRDSLVQAKPFATVTVNDIGGRSNTLKIFRENKNRVLGLVMDDQPVSFDPQRVRAIIRPKSFFGQK